METDSAEGPYLGWEEKRRVMLVELVGRRDVSAWWCRTSRLGERCAKYAGEAKKQAGWSGGSGERAAQKHAGGGSVAEVQQWARRKGVDGTFSSAS